MIHLCHLRVFSNYNLGGFMEEKNSSLANSAVQKKDSVFEIEKGHLGSVVGVMDSLIGDLNKENADYKQSIIETQDYIAHNQIDPQELDGLMAIINRTDYNIAKNNGMIKRYTKQRNNPFFSKIVFTDDEGDKEFYIGLKDIYQHGVNYVLDWRAPISSLYYYSNLGKAHYMAPLGQIDVDLKLKRQFKINEGTLKYYIDTDSQVSDQALQDALSENASSYMKNIVQTIQEEQDQIIREDVNATVVINGIAGSGKTSIAMHRIAYLLYANRDKLKNENAMVISPNLLFSKYISQLLPELEEENVATKPLVGSLMKIAKVLSVEKKENLIEEILNCNDELYKEIQEKYSFDYFLKMKKYLCDYNENIKNTLYSLIHKYLEEQNIKRKSNVEVFADTREITEQQIKDLYYISREHPEDIDASLILTVQRIANFYYYFDTPAKQKVIATKIYNDVMKRSYFRDAYNDFLMKNGYKPLPKDNVPYEDLSGLAYFAMNFIGGEKDTYVKHLFIDEMQDYDATTLAIIKRMYPEANFTIVGDFEQNLMIIGDNKEALKYNFPTAKFYDLYTSYRSTNNIVDLGFAILGTPKPKQAMVRDGKQPAIVKCNNINERFKLINEDLASQVKQGRRVAILCKTKKEAELVSKYVKDATLILDETNEALFDAKVIITTTYFSKGLEFDAVIVPDVSEENFCKVQDKQNLYVAITRALHEVNMYYEGKLTHFIPAKYENMK